MASTSVGGRSTCGLAQRPPGSETGRRCWAIEPSRLLPFASMAQSPPLLQLSNIALTFGGTPLLQGAELAVSAGERVCLVGRNGSGKSSLLRIAAGIIEADHGARF